VGDLLQRALPVDTLVVAIDPGKARNRVWLSTDAGGLRVDPVTLPVLREGIDELERLVGRHAGGRPPLIAIEATGGLHRAWMHELNRRFPALLRWWRQGPGNWSGDRFPLFRVRRLPLPARGHHRGGALVSALWTVRQCCVEAPRRRDTCG
jgi:hypothetical protein